MTRLAVAAPLPEGRRPWFLLRLCTSNPFYVLSAALFLLGLRISFGEQIEAVQTWALMSGLAGYTLLLAVTAGLLVRFENVWDDVRTVLLLVVLMFLATSVTFDEVLVLDPGRGAACFLVGLLFAVCLSEALLRGIRLKLPAGFRVPYYLILALFFLYPVALQPLLDDPQGEPLQWGLFAFSTVAGLVFLTLLPAVRRGPDYVRDNGSPWGWPLYPWALFVFLGLAVPARAVLLCWSMQLLGNTDRGRLIFGLYFLVPFGLAVAVLLLEIGLVSARRGVLRAALAVPAGLLFLALVGHRDDPIYQGFRRLFAARLGGDPLYLTLIASTCFYGYAALRGVRRATEALTAALAALAFVGPDTLDTAQLIALWPVPILAAAVLQAALGLWRRSSWRCLLGAVGGAVFAALVLPPESVSPPLRNLLAFHLVLLAVLLVGALFTDDFARVLREVGVAVVLLTGLAELFVWSDQPARLPLWALVVYPPALAALLVGYGLLLRHRPAVAAAAVLLASWLAAVCGRGYAALRQVVAGLDYLALSLLLFAVAVLVSLAKAGALRRWFAAWRGRLPDSAD